ncbi:MULTISPECIES: formate dehydrogenase accessory sulfurtransferase FdhD [Neptunomonas]|uniref:formate dehydrogenase accessory sulfurtransferase FdhD n=1 Tax=Neptunomonas TaxID=75687 RepID=UPI0025AEDABA|nr:formate dehydrogenase accessory sulfurtransferase FdhD [Neptunomonas sp. CHC150]MDN2659948.1 formate dehydrogenase accessory sulfurtransferase FdhD [Neptunomonas sp. CHC150]
MEQPFESVIRSYAQAPLTEQATVIDELGGERTIQIACERPLTIYLNKREIVTLMTLGADPEALVVGYLKNQGFIERAEDLTAVQVDWDVESAAVVTRKEPAHLASMLEKRTVTSGCGQGTMFGDLMEKIANVELPVTPVKQSMIYSLLRALSQHNETYKNAGAVHACAVSDGDYIVSFVEDVGRHNAVDTLAGRLWLQGISPNGKIFYTTGRLTSEMVIKVAQMGISVLLSRSGVTQMGLALAREMGITLLARAKGRHFLIFHGRDMVDLDCLQEGKGVQGE